MHSRRDRTILRNRNGPIHRVEDEGVNVVAAFIEGEEGLFEVAAAVAGEEAEDVFEEDEGRLAGFEAVEEVDEAPKGGGFLAAETFPAAGDGEVVAGEGGGEELAVGDVARLQVVDVADDEVVVVGPVVAVHLGLVVVDVVGEDDLPVLTFQGKADEADAGEELGGAGFSYVGTVSVSQSVFAFAKSLENYFGIGGYMVVFVEATDGAAVAEKAAGFAGFGVAADVGNDRFVQAVEENLDAGCRRGTVSRAFGRAEDVGGEEAVEASYVEVVVAEIGFGDPHQTRF
jgi:hypothetical protein